MATTSIVSPNQNPLQSASGVAAPATLRQAVCLEFPFICGESSQVNNYATRASDLDGARSSRGHMAYAVAVTGAQRMAAAFVTGQSSNNANSAQGESNAAKEVVTDVKTGQTVTRAARVLQRYVAPTAAPKQISDAASEVSGVVAAEGEVAQGSRALNALGTGVKVLGGVGSIVGIPASLATTVMGGMEIHDGYKKGDKHEEVSGLMQVGSGLAGTTASVAGTMGFLGSAATAAAAAPVAIIAGGAAAAISGVRDIYNAKDAYHRNVGIAKTAGGTAMMVGAAMCATGVGAPLGAALVVGGAIVTAGSYLANTETGQKVIGAVEHAGETAVHAVVDAGKATVHAVAEAGAATVHAVVDAGAATVHAVEHVGAAAVHGVAQAASSVGHAAQKAWGWATSWF